MIIKTKRITKHNRKSQVASRKYKKLKGGSNYMPHQKPSPPSVFKIINNNVAKQRANNIKFSRTKTKRTPTHAASDHKKLMISSPIIGRVNSTNGFTTLTNTKGRETRINTSKLRMPSSEYYRIFNNALRSASADIEQGKNKQQIISKYLNERTEDWKRAQKSKEAYDAALVRDYVNFLNTGNNNFSRYPKLELQPEKEKVLVPNPNYTEAYSEPYVNSERLVNISSASEA